jgi:hypothetical protein
LEIAFSVGVTAGRKDDLTLCVKDVRARLDRDGFVRSGRCGVDVNYIGIRSGYGCGAVSDDRVADQPVELDRVIQ